MLLKNFRASEFQATFSVTNDAWAIPFYLIFNAKDTDEFNQIVVYHSSPGIAPSGNKIVNGALPASVAADSTPTAVPACTTSDTLWVRVRSDSGTVTVKAIQKNDGAPSENDWSGASACYQSSNFTTDGGQIGFAGGYYHIFIDNFTLQTKDSQGGWTNPVTEHVETFTINGSGQAEDMPTHDAAGNMTYDGQHKFSYDAWNRLTQVQRAFCYDNDTLNPASTVAIMKYDGLGNRVSKQILNSGDWSSGDCTTTYHYYYDGQSIIEERNGSNCVLKQYVWGAQYIDELVQTALNDDPTDANEQNCETLYWVLQDANYNVMGIVGSNGDLKERYEYTPYGQRVAYKSAGSADLLCMSSMLAHSQAFVISTVDQPYGLCDFGMQGKLFDKEFGTYYWNARQYHPTLARAMQTDPTGYSDGMNRFEWLGGRPISLVDPEGLANRSLSPIFVLSPIGWNWWAPDPGLPHEPARPPLESEIIRGNSPPFQQNVIRMIKEHLHGSLTLIQFGFKMPIPGATIPGVANVELSIFAEGKFTPCCDLRKSEVSSMFLARGVIKVDAGVGTSIGTEAGADALKMIPPLPGYAIGVDSAALPECRNDLDGGGKLYLYAKAGFGVGSEFRQGIGSCTLQKGCQWEFDKRSFVIRTGIWGARAGAALEGFVQGSAQ